MQQQKNLCLFPLQTIGQMPDPAPCITGMICTVEATRGHASPWIYCSSRESANLYWLIRRTQIRIFPCCPSPQIANPQKAVFLVQILICLPLILIYILYYTILYYTILYIYLYGQKHNFRAAFTTTVYRDNTAKPHVFCKYRNERNYLTKKPHQNLWSPRSVAYSKPSPGVFWWDIHFKRIYL